MHTQDDVKDAQRRAGRARVATARGTTPPGGAESGRSRGPEAPLSGRSAVSGAVRVAEGRFAPGRPGRLTQPVGLGTGQGAGGRVEGGRPEAA